MTVAANIVASDVTCTEEQELELGQDVIKLEELIVKAEATLAFLQYALLNATGTTAVFSTNAPTTPISNPENLDLECPAAGVSCIYPDEINVLEIIEDSSMINCSKNIILKI